MDPVTTKRLIVRRMAPADLQDFLAYQTHRETLRYQPVEPLSAEAAARFLARQADLTIGPEGGYIAFAIELGSTSRMIGEVGIYISPEPRSKGDLGWSLHPDYHGQGYATEAAQVLLRYAFHDRKLHRVTSVCDTENAASSRLMERLGMRREGHFQQSQFSKGVWHDEYFYALLRTEWLKRQAATEE